MMSSRNRLIISVTAAFVVLIGILYFYDQMPLAFWGNRSPKIVFLGQDERGIFQLQTVDAQIDAQPTYLTSGSLNILDYAVSADGRQIVYTLSDPDGSHDLYLYDLVRGDTRLILDCTAASCTQPVWSSNQERFVYERRDFSFSNQPPGPARLWWFDLNNAQTIPVFEDPQQFGLGAAFSPDGGWLAFVVPLREEILAVNLQSGESIRLASSTGESPVWGSNNALYFTEIDLQGEIVTVHLYKLESETGRIVDLSGQNSLFDDGSVQWHPDSRQLVFTRKPARTAAGKQLWLMSDDGENPTSLTDNVAVHNGLPVWSPDGRYLAVQRFEITEPFAEPEIWLVDLVEGREIQLASAGIQPGWIP